MPASSVFADRVRRKTGLSLVGAFDTDSDGLKRRFAVTVDLRLIPATKLKPDTGSAFHGIELGDKLPMPFAWVIPSDAKSYELTKGSETMTPGGDVPRRVIVPLTGKARIEAGERFFQTSKDAAIWLRARDLDIASPPPEWPEVAEHGGKWIDISITQQTLVLYQGKKPYYATLVSTGRDKLGDPKETLSTPRGSFKLQSKHVAAAMDSEENSSVSGGQRARASGHSESAKSTAERLKKRAPPARSRRGRQAPPAQHRQGPRPRIRHHRAPRLRRLRAARRAVDPVFRGRLRAARRVLARRVRNPEKPRLREPLAHRRPRRLPLDRSARARGLARDQRRLRDGRRHRRHHSGK